MPTWLFIILPLLLGWLLDLLFGDPQWLPHPVVGFGKMIATGERWLNKGTHRKLKGALLTLFLVGLVFAVTWTLLYVTSGVMGNFHFWLRRAEGSLFTFHFSLKVLLIFFCLAGTTLIREVRQTFLAVDRSLEDGRKQVARIVGRDTSELSAQEIRTAALETLAENLSDGVIAPLFWLVVGGVPGMLAYKMVNTLDSMIGYKTERYKDFGCFAARLDDVANYLPARITAFLMIVPKLMTINTHRGSKLFTFHFSLFTFVRENGRRHASPNSGYPEAALAGILNCRFGGPHTYFGQLFDKPYIGENDRPLTTDDMRIAIRINRTAECLAVLLSLLLMILLALILPINSIYPI